MNTFAFLNKKTVLVAASFPIALFLHGCGGVQDTCKSDSECGDLYKCVGGTCALKQCSRDTDCSGSNNFCNPSGVCASFCRADSDCGGNNNCVNNVCFAECTLDDDCDVAGGYTCDTSVDGGTCLPGVPPTTPGATCTDSDAQCARCRSDDQTLCAACNDGFKIDDETGQCVDACPGAGQYFSEGRCLCEQANYIVVDGQCMPNCTPVRRSRVHNNEA